MRWLRKGEFYVFYLKDYDTMTYNVIGPVFEGDNIDARTYELIKQGRNLRIRISQPQKDSRGFHPGNYLQDGPEGFSFDPNLRW